MAEQVMRMPEPINHKSVQRQSIEEQEEVQMKPLATAITPFVQREAAVEEDKEQLQTKHLNATITSLVQRKYAACEAVQRSPSLQPKAADGEFQASSDIESQLSRSKGGGSPLSDEVRSFMEPRFGADFSQVHVHTDSEAVQMNRKLNAQAFTHGSDIYFGAGKSAGISNLTAHELTHVVQQTGAVQLQSGDRGDQTNPATEIAPNFETAVQKGDMTGEWADAALILNGYAMFDILPKASKLNLKQLDCLTQAAAEVMKGWPPRVQFAVEGVKTSKLPSKEMQQQINPDQVEDAKKFLDSQHFRVGSDITSIFEGGKPGTLQTVDTGIISYGKHQATLASGSLYSVLKTYTELSQAITAAEIAKYLDQVKKRDTSLRNNQSFLQLLNDAASDPEMERAQDLVFAKNYWQPAVTVAEKVGVTSALGKEIFYDTNVQGGLKTILKNTQARFMGVQYTEQQFLLVFLEERRKHLNAIAQRQHKQADEERTKGNKQKAKRLETNAKMLENAAKSRVGALEALVKSADLDLLGDREGKIKVGGKKITGLRRANAS